MYVPQNRSQEELLPVMVWFFGGGYTIGDGYISQRASDSCLTYCRYEFGFYDGKNLAAKHNVVIVTMNYRLNTFGFMALNELLQESVEGCTQ